MSKVFYLHQTFTDCLSILNVTASYGGFSDSIAFFILEFSYVITCLTRYVIASSNFYKLCANADV